MIEHVTMTTRVKRWLLAHLPWLGVSPSAVTQLPAQAAPEPPAAPLLPPDALRAHVHSLTRAVDDLDAGGEYKRHVVYAQLLKAYPHVARRRLAWLIEDVLLDREH